LNFVSKMIKFNVVFNGIKKYNDFKSMLTDLNFKNFNPKSKCIEDSLNIYLKPNGIYSKKREEKNGVVAIIFEIII
jgi:ASC-1-like (ASCH) protein